MIPHHVVLMGPPGAGKSTHAQEIAAALGVKVIDTGDMLREEVASGSDVGMQADSYMKRGDLVPADLVATVLDRRLAQPDVQNGFVLDGYPRRMEDALHLIDWAKNTNVHDLSIVGLQVPLAEILRRVSGRRVCEDGHNVNIDQAPPKVPDHCDLDGTALTRRPDDEPAVVEHRMDVYNEETQPVIDFLKQQGLYQEIDGTGTPEQVQQRLLAKLAEMAQHAPALSTAASTAAQT